MTHVTQLLEAAHNGDKHAAAKLLPLVYAELRQLAAAKLAHEKPGQTLNATALVHEAYLRLIGDQQFDGRRHFFAAAAEAMRRILVEAARRRMAMKRGGPTKQAVDLELNAIAAPGPDEQVLNVNDALDSLAEIDPEAAMLVKLRFFGGLTMPEVASAFGMSTRSAHDVWAFARSWLQRSMRHEWK